MIESHLTSERLVDYHNELDDFTNLNLTDTITQAFREVVRDVKNSGYELRKLCKRYSLQSGVTKTEDFTGTITTDQDYLERMKLVVAVTAITGGSPKWTLQGSDDDGDNYTTVVTTSAATATGNITSDMTNVFKKYRLNLAYTVEGSFSVTYSAYLIESIYEDLHLYKSLELAYRDFAKTTRNDYGIEQANYYAQKYHSLLSDTEFKYDDNDDGEISESESEYSGQIKFTR